MIVYDKILENLFAIYQMNWWDYRYLFEWLIESSSVVPSFQGLVFDLLLKMTPLLQHVLSRKIPVKLQSSSDSNNSKYPDNDAQYKFPFVHKSIIRSIWKMLNLIKYYTANVRTNSIQINTKLLCFKYAVHWLLNM